MNDRGFTLIELLIVVVVIGILATIAIPRLGQTREQAFVAAMQSDLRQLIHAQELYYQANEFTYFTSSLPDAGFPFNLTDGVTIALSSEDPSSGYSAIASHANASATCALSVGEGAAQGAVQCEQSGDGN